MPLPDELSSAIDAAAEATETELVLGYLTKSLLKKFGDDRAFRSSQIRVEWSEMLYGYEAQVSFPYAGRQWITKTLVREEDTYIKTIHEWNTLIANTHAKLRVTLSTILRAEGFDTLPPAPVREMTTDEVKQTLEEAERFKALEAEAIKSIKETIQRNTCACEWEAIPPNIACPIHRKFSPPQDV